MSKSEVIPQVQISKIPERLKKLKAEATQKENDFIDVMESLYDAFKEKQQQVVDRVAETPEAINKNVHEKPWIYIGGAAAIGLLTGFILGRR